jgi:RHS repeat-associated protein
LGSTVNLTGQTGNTQVSYLLDPWGHIKDQIGVSVNRQIFTGQEHDPHTGLIYFGARYYDPGIARFITQDPYLGETSTPPSLHRYLYAYSNPTVYVDLEGYAAETLLGVGADYIRDYVKDSQQFITEMNKHADKGLGKRSLAAVMGIGNSSLEIVAGTMDMTDMAKDAAIATSPIFKDTETGRKAQQRLEETGKKVVLTAKQAYTYVTTEDPSAMAQKAKEKLGNYLEKTFVEGDLNYTADFSGNAFITAATGAQIRGAQLSKAAAAEEAVAKTALRERVLANVAESKAARESSGFLEASKQWTTADGILGPSGTGQFIIKSEGMLESATVIKRGEFVNRMFDSKYGSIPDVSGSMGRSFAPGSGLPTTATEGIMQRGLNIYNQNDAQQAIIYKAIKNMPATKRVSIQGTTPEVLIESEFRKYLSEVRKYPVIP